MKLPVGYHTSNIIFVDSYVVKFMEVLSVLNDLRLLTYLLQIKHRFMVNSTVLLRVDVSKK
jgi:hypothetical protein